MPDCDTGLLGPLVFATVVGVAACDEHPVSRMPTTAKEIRPARVTRILLIAWCGGRG
jgi:hypothetical protein